MSSLIIVGSGGQGIRFMGNLLSKLLILKNYEVSAMYDYDAAMRGSDITAFIMFSESKIENPLIDVPDLLLVLAKAKVKFSGKEVVCDSAVALDGAVKIDFSSIAEKEFSKKAINMLALGFLIKKFNIDVSESELLEVLPAKGKEENLKAVIRGMKI